MTSFSVFLKCCKEGTFWAGTMKYSMLPLFSPALAPRFFLYFIDLKNKTVYLSFNKKRVLLISGMSAWDECWVVRLLYSSSWWGSLVVCVCVCVALACSLSLPPSACVRVCVFAADRMSFKAGNSWLESHTALHYQKASFRRTGGLACKQRSIATATILFTSNQLDCFTLIAWQKAHCNKSI